MMKFEFHCESCSKGYALPYERIKGRVLKVRCKQCQHLMIVRDPQRPEPSVSVASASAPSKPAPAEREVAQDMGAQTLFSLQAIPSREEEEARLSAHNAPPQAPPQAPPPSPEPLPKPAAAPALEQPTYQSERSVKVEVPKPTDEWVKEMQEELSKPITKEIKLDELNQGVRSAQPAPPRSKTGLIALVAVASLGGLAFWQLPQLLESPEAPLPVLQQEQTQEGLIDVSSPLSAESTLPSQADTPPADPKRDSAPKEASPLGGASAPSAPEEGEGSKLEGSKLEGSKLEGALKVTPKADEQPASPSPVATETVKSKTTRSTKRTSSRSTPAQTPKVNKRAEQAKRSTQTKRTKRTKRPKGKGLPQASVRQIVQQNSGSLSYCYQKIAKKDTSLGAVKTRLSFEVLPDGRTDASKVSLSGKHKGSRLEGCIRMAVQRWRFPSAEGSTPVRYPLNFTPSF